MLLRIPRLYDSHSHFLGTGQIRLGLSLFNLKSAEDIKNIPLRPDYFRGDWLVGFGWDQNNWTNQTLPHRSILDQIFPHHPVFLSRVDGHSSWLNSRALAALGLLDKTESEFPNPLGGLIHRDREGKPTGLLSDAAHMLVFEKLPPYSSAQIKVFLKEASAIFNRAGFTHVRDMSCTETQWQQMTLLEEQKDFTVALDANYTVENLQSLEQTLADCLAAKRHETEQLRAKGIKLFYDGSLGSETALLSIPYGGLKEGNRGLVSWSIQDVEIVLRKTWEAGLEFSVHVIGDQAVHEMISLARDVSAAGLVGKINLEHAQVVRPETIPLMKPLHIRCHMQPCHWLNDQRWLKEKLGALYKNAFPWEALRLAKIPLSFGCDSPVEPTSLVNNLRALRESPQQGIRALGADPLSYHSHPDSGFADSYTLFEEDHLKAVFFRNREIPL